MGARLKKRRKRDEEPLTEAGWPRPESIVGRLPIPWSTLPSNFGENDEKRRNEASKGKICQLCGLPHKKRSRGYIFLTDEKSEHQERPTHRLKGFAQAMDRAILHYRCAILALRFCPHLLKRRRKRQLVMFSVPTHSGWEIDGKLLRWKRIPGDA